MWRPFFPVAMPEKKITCVQIENAASRVAQASDFAFSFFLMSPSDTIDTLTL